MGEDEKSESSDKTGVEKEEDKREHIKLAMDDNVHIDARDVLAIKDDVVLNRKEEEENGGGDNSKGSGVMDSKEVKNEEVGTVRNDEDEKDGVVTNIMLDMSNTELVEDKELIISVLMLKPVDDIYQVQVQRHGLHIWIVDIAAVAMILTYCSTQ